MNLPNLGFRYVFDDKQGLARLMHQFEKTKKSALAVFLDIQVAHGHCVFEKNGNVCTEVDFFCASDGCSNYLTDSMMFLHEIIEHYTCNT